MGLATPKTQSIPILLMPTMIKKNLNEAASWYQVVHQVPWPDHQRWDAKMEAQPECVHIAYTFSHVWHQFACLSRCLLTRFPHRSSVGSLTRVRCWLGVCYFWSFPPPPPDFFLFLHPSPSPPPSKSFSPSAHVPFSLIPPSLPTAPSPSSPKVCWPGTFVGSRWRGGGGDRW